MKAMKTGAAAATDSTIRSIKILNLKEVRQSQDLPSLQSDIYFDDDKSEFHFLQPGNIKIIMKASQLIYSTEGSGYLHPRAEAITTGLHILQTIPKDYVIISRHSNGTITSNEDSSTTKLSSLGLHEDKTGETPVPFRVVDAKENTITLKPPFEEGCTITVPHEAQIEIKVIGSDGYMLDDVNITISMPDDY